MGRFDELGSGILNINKYCKAYSGHDHPEFIEGAIFRTIVPLDEDLVDGDDAANDTLNGDDAVNDTLNDAANDTLNGDDAVNDRIKTVIEQWELQYKKPVREKLTQLLVLLYQQEGLKAEELAMMLKLKLKTVKRYLKISKEREIIERPHPKKEGGYYLTQSFRKEIEK